jgi:hypothetical protein
VPVRGAAAGHPGVGAAAGSDPAAASPRRPGICQTGAVSFGPPPATACWQHRAARAGFEVAYFQASQDGWRIDGTTAALEDGQTWVVTYTIWLDPAWATRGARVTARSNLGLRRALLEPDGAGRWYVNGDPARHLDGCMDIDLEASAMTNALPVHRLRLPVGARAEPPAAYVRAPTLAVERLEQTYLRTTDEGAHQRYEYTAPAFDFTCRLLYDQSGLVLDYPGIAVRAG